MEASCHTDQKVEVKTVVEIIGKMLELEPCDATQAAESSSVALKA